MAAKTSNRRKRRREPNPHTRPTVPCFICGKQFRQITQTHLQRHGYTLARYQRTFDAPIRPQRPAGPRPAVTPRAPSTTAGLPAPVAPSASAYAPRVAEHLLGNPEFVAALADEVGELIFTTSMRDRLRTALCSVLSTRLQLHGQAVANLEAIRAELDQPWRVQHGGKDGEPTPTPHLVAMAGEAHQEVTKAEDALLKTVKMAIDETKAQKDAIHALGSRPAFSGEQASIPVPPELPPSERETVRGLLGLLKQEVEARRAKLATPINVQAEPSRPAATTSPPPEQPPPPAEDPVPLA